MSKMLSQPFKNASAHLEVVVVVAAAAAVVVIAEAAIEAVIKTEPTKTLAISKVADINKEEAAVVVVVRIKQLFKFWFLCFLIHLQVIINDKTVAEKKAVSNGATAEDEEEMAASRSGKCRQTQSNLNSSCL